MTIYSYAGQVGGSTLDPLGPVLATTGALAIADPSPVGAVLTIDVPVSADVVAGSSFVVEIAETDQRNTSGQLTSYFHLAANGDAQTAPSYWRSDACSDPQPRLEASGSIFSVIGYTE